MREHSFILNEQGKPYKRQRVGDGIHLVLAKDGDKTVSHSFSFDANKYTVDSASDYMDKIGYDYKKIKASKPLDGKVWSSGMHHVFVNDKPSRVYVPESTIINTFNQMKAKIVDEGSIKLGIDHLSDDILNENDILRKLNLLDIGEVNNIVTDGTGIFIKESNITNEAIQELHERGELPAYSIVGGMNAKPCPRGEADYIVENIDVERIDVVGEGGCESCKVGVKPSDIILTAKLSNKEEFNMVEANEAPVKESVEEVPKEEEVVPAEEAVEEPVAEEPKVEEVPIEEPEEEVVEEPKEEEKPPVEEDVVAILKKEIEDLKETIANYAGKKADTDEAADAVEAVINAGKAYPKQRESFLSFARADLDGFKKFAASLPQVIDMSMKAKLAQDAKKKQEAEKQAAEEEAVKAQLEDIFRVKL